ncbi:exported protein of unknown function [Candidatus Filomicrobium marinum]|uniref:EF-hand domain-containing protein n=2 Tax=Filomicrobium TaxID=119044 RepID=A0A0D6JEM2_9HYPH|nr:MULTISPECIES: hypothetical protein [Filomicrobium]CFX15700.1 exported protein of unknown function [Candidatus Filomicrobium marinum]CPR18000.1 exported protein of unknown function [Candidatus Filomicrobium marinum]SDO25032.1 hypothetical protein SAMN04488061_0692 [Filomicrobium insigne]
MIRKLSIALSACCAVAATVATVSPAAVASEPTFDDRREIACSIIAKHDRDRDGRLNIFEAKRAGKKAFKTLDTNGNWTLQYPEVGNRISPAAFDRYDRIKIRGMDRIEWTRLVKARFRAASQDRRTVTCDDLLMSREGRDLLAVIWY